MELFDKIKVPARGSRIDYDTDRGFIVPDEPIIPYIEGDGVGPDVMKAMRIVLDGSIQKIYKGDRRIVWLEIYAGEKAKKFYGEYLPDDTLKAIRHYHIGIKGPLTTPVGGGFRSLNVALRQKLDLYACVRPCIYIPGVPSPVRKPETIHMIIFRENTEDVYAGIEWPVNSDDVNKIREFIKSELGIEIRGDSSIGLKPISEFCSKRLVRAAVKYAVKNGLPTVTLVHKGNIMKFTEGYFRKWGYEVALDEFRDVIITEEELYRDYNGIMPPGKILIKDRIADNMLQQILTRTGDYHVLATPNLNGDYISDACAAQIGGLGMAPGANIGDGIAVFEATHGSSPKYAGLDKVNPTSIILSAVMMLEYMGWEECAKAIKDAIQKTIQKKIVTYDLARQMDGVTPVKTSEYAKAIIENLDY
ncbi:MAG: isocitrate dehydrogenase (NADP(+)) [Promethearchaeota archaeon]